MAQVTLRTGSEGGTMKLRELIPASQHEAAEQALKKAHETSLQERDPILLKVLTGFSAWVASLFLLGFIGAGLQPEEEAIIAFGFLITGLAIAIHQMAKNAGVFLQQSTLACMMCGHILLLFGVLIHFDYGNELLTLSITQTLLCALPMVAFRNAAYQLSSLLLAACFWTFYSVEMNAPTLFRLLLIVEVSAFGALTIWKAKNHSFCYALAIAIGGSIFFLDWIQSDLWNEPFNEALWPSNLILAALVGIIGVAFLTNAQRSQPKILMLYVILLALAFLSSPGLLYATALLLLGYGLKDRIYLGLGLLSLPLFVFYFYYSLQISLLEKSGVLIASGALCLLIAWLAKRSADSATHSKGVQS